MGCAFCGVSSSGGRGLAGRGAGRTSIGGGNGGASCCAWWLTGGPGGLAAAGAFVTGALASGGKAGGMASGRGAFTRGLVDDSGAVDVASGKPSDGAIDAGVASPRSMESSRLVSRSIVLTASHDDNAATSTVRFSASGDPAAKIAISGGLACPAPAPGAASVARMSV